MDIITETLAGPFQYDFMLRALIVSVLVGIMCPMIGAYVVVRGLGFMGDGLAHGVLPGVAAAVLIGAIAGVGAIERDLHFFLGALPAALVMAVLSGYLIRRVGVSEDTSVGILFAGMFALGLVMLTAARGLPVKLDDILLGNVLGVSQEEMLVTLGLAAVVLLTMFFIHKELVFSNFDPLGASVIGLPTEKLEYILLGLLAVVVVLALQAVGIVLVISMLITPAATASLLTRSFPAAMVGGAIFGSAAAISGLYISFHFNLPSGPLMALMATTFFVLALAWKQRPARLMRRQRA
jgi:manganese/iron transport system permease protein